MDISKLNQTLIEEPIFRLKQAKRAVFVNLVDNWDQTTNFSKKLRDELNKNCPISIKAEFLKSIKSDSLKALITLSDGLKIETVLLSHGVGRNTICLSSQVGCAIGCSFCATGKRGFKRNLTAEEMIEQIILFARLLKKRNQRVNNVVFMGMGEPFLNYDNVLAAVKTINDKDGFNLGARHISISTVGIIEGIKKFTEENLQVNLAISLHAANNSLRSKLVPLNEIFPIEAVLAAVDDYIKKTRRKVMFEYLMIAGINDSEKDAYDLAALLKKPLYFVNLISYNPIGHSDFKTSSPNAVKKFKEILEKSGITATQRYKFGREIKGACGQLAAK